MKETLDTLINKLKHEHLCKHYKEYDEEVQQYLIANDSKTEDDGINFKIDLEPSKEEINKMISLVDLSTFCKIIQCRLKREYDGAFSIDYEKPTMKDIGTITKKWAEEYLKDWAKAKYRFYKIFGDKLTLEKEIEHIPTENDARVLKETLKSNFPLYIPILDRIAYSIIKDNKMSAGSYGSEFDAIKDVNKMTFTKFMSLYNNKELDMEISKLYQANGKTNISISINPIDYLTVSINKAEWKSCHNFFDGCYGTAGLSLLFDETSIVGFSSNGMVKYSEYYKEFTWNSKKWREMIYVSKDNSAMVFSRQYPFTDERFSKALRQLMEEQYSNYFKAKNQWYSITNNNKYIDVVTHCSLLYNDVSSGYSYKAVRNKQDINKEQTECIIGKQLKHLSDEHKESDIRNGERGIW